MGNSPKLEGTKETILWLDKNVYNEENKFTYEKYIPKLKKFNFFCFVLVKELINYIEDNSDYFKFKLFYVVVSGRLAESFYKEYIKIAEKYNTIANTTVYCLKQKYHETKPYFMDKYLNPGGISVDFEKVLNYILKDECDWANIEKRFKKYIPKEENFGDSFTCIDTSKEYELALPILIGKYINSSLIEKNEITNFQNLLISRYVNYYSIDDMKFIKPSGNKNMNIPLHILTNFFINFYTKEKKDKNGRNFYSDLNYDLSNNKFDDYHPFIILIYDCLNKKYIKPYKKALYRGTLISESEFNKFLKDIANKKNKDKKPIYYSKCFLSFSKDIKVAYYHLERCKKYQKPNTIIVLFILDECKDENFFVTNVDIELLSYIKKEKEALHLPLSCFEIVKIEDEETYKNFKYRKIYLTHLDKYKKKIESKIMELWENKDNSEIGCFFTKSMNSHLGKNFLDCFDKEKKSKLTQNYTKILNVPPNNSYFLTQIANNFMLKSTRNTKSQTAAHIDDEIGNVKEEYKCSEREDKDICKLENKDEITKFLDEHLKYIDLFDNSFSIGYCLGNFLSNYKSFIKAPNSSKAFCLASLALACGPHIIKLIPKIKYVLKKKLINNTILDLELLLDGLNILWAVGVELYYIFEYQAEYKRNISLTLRYAGKRLTNLIIAWNFSYLGTLVVKAGIYGFTVITGISLAPFVTATIGILGGLAGGFLGNNTGSYLAEKIFGKDEFKLTSGNIYYRYIPDKYRKEGNNPHLQWNEKPDDNIESYIIECIINDVDIQMRVMNIPKEVFELPECLGYYEDYSAYDSETDFSSDEENNKRKEKKYHKIFKKGKFIGDLIIPYKGIKVNAFKIDFVIYRITKKEISIEEWINFRDRKNKEKFIQDCYIYSVY